MNLPIDRPAHTWKSVSWEDVYIRTNPFKPTIVPLSVFQDLVTLPKLIRDIGRWLTKPKVWASPRTWADVNLATRFGIEPMISDAKSLVTLQDRINNKFNRLKRWYQEGTTHVRVTVDEYQETLPPTVLWLTSVSGYTARRRVDRYYSGKKWATARWKLLNPPPTTPDDDTLRKLARDTVLGLTREATLQGAWDMVPWSFIIDWFSNAAQYLMAEGANQQRCYIESACEMFHEQIRYVVSPLDTPPPEVKDTGCMGPALWESKTRRVLGPNLFPFVNLPVLDMGDVSVLGSLAVQRLRRRRS